MRGFYVDLSGWPGCVHELRDGDYPLCGAGATAKQPAIRTENPVSCGSCLRCLSTQELEENSKRRRIRYGRYPR